MDILVLSSLARLPMHGYELELELRYRHVRWWAKCEHSHLYSALSRLEKSGDILVVGESEHQGRVRRVLQVSDKGRARLRDSLVELGRGADDTYFGFDLFLSGSYLLERSEVLALLDVRLEALAAQQVEASALRESMSGKVPKAAELIIGHRIAHLANELEWARRVRTELENVESWGSFLGTERIRSFVARTGVEVEESGA